MSFDWFNIEKCLKNSMIRWTGDSCDEALYFFSQILSYTSTDQCANCGLIYFWCDKDRVYSSESIATKSILAQDSLSFIGNEVFCSDCVDDCSLCLQKCSTKSTHICYFCGLKTCSQCWETHKKKCQCHDDIKYVGLVRTERDRIKQQFRRLELYGLPSLISLKIKQNRMAQKSQFDDKQLASVHIMMLKITDKVTHLREYYHDVLFEIFSFAVGKVIKCASCGRDHHVWNNDTSETCHFSQVHRDWFCNKLVVDDGEVTILDCNPSSRINALYFLVREVLTRRLISNPVAMPNDRVLRSLLAMMFENKSCRLKMVVISVINTFLAYECSKKFITLLQETNVHKTMERHFFFGNDWRCALGAIRILGNMASDKDTAILSTLR